MSDLTLQKALVTFLRNRGKMPEVRTGYLPPGTSGEFERDTAFTPEAERVGPNGRVTISPNLPPIFANATIAHELGHAADEQLSNQYFDTTYMEGGKRRMFSRGKDQFTDTFEKLRIGKERGSNPRVDLASRLDPKWTKEKADYRSTSNELAGWGAGSTVGAPGYGEAPGHLNPTMATELAIMMELAERMRAKKK